MIELGGMNVAPKEANCDEPHTQDVSSAARKEFNKILSPQKIINAQRPVVSHSMHCYLFLRFGVDAINRAFIPYPEA